MADPNSTAVVQNATNDIFYYSRGLGGVDVPRDVLITRIIYSTTLFVVLFFFAGRIAQIVHAYFRYITAAAASKRQQAHWGIETSPLYAKLKKHFLYAPLGKKRHNREIQLSSVVNVGTVPSRFQTILIGAYLLSQIFYCSFFNYKDHTKQEIFAQIRGRSGTLALMNMVPLFILAGRNNPLISLLHISFDTYNLIHRWLGRIFMLESVLHTIAWAVNGYYEQNMTQMWHRLFHIPFFTWGFVGTIASIWLSIHSVSPLRHAFYETFLLGHQIGAFFALLGVWLHLKLDGLFTVHWASAIWVLWASDRFVRFVRLVYLNISLKNGRTKVVVEALPGEACRVTFHLPKRVHVEAGTHVYAYLPSISLWMSHPFSVAWVEGDTSSTTALVSAKPKMPMSPAMIEKQAGFSELDSFMKQTTASRQSTKVTLICAAQKGMTRTLYHRALAASRQTLYTTGFIEGPYPSSTCIINANSYGTAILFSAGAGITHHMLTVRSLLNLAYEGRAATQQIYLIWSVRNTDHLCWVQDFMNEILRLPNRREILVVKLFISKPKSSREIASPSSTVQMFAGRCKPGVVLEEVLPNRVGATMVSVCGPGAFADEVRSATRERIGRGMVLDFVEEAFTW